MFFLNLIYNLNINEINIVFNPLLYFKVMGFVKGERYMPTNYYQELGILPVTPTAEIKSIINNEIAKIKQQKATLENTIGLIRDITHSLNELDNQIGKLKTIYFYLGNDEERKKYDIELAELTKLTPLDIFQSKDKSQFSHPTNKSFLEMINGLINDHNQGVILKDTPGFYDTRKKFYSQKRRVEWVIENCYGKVCTEAQWLLTNLTKTKFIEIVIEGKILSPAVQLTNPKVLPATNSSTSMEKKNEVNENGEQYQAQLEFQPQVEQYTKKISQLENSNVTFLQEIENLEKQKRNPIINFLSTIFSLGCYNKNNKLRKEIAEKTSEIKNNKKIISKIKTKINWLESLYKNSEMPATTISAINNQPILSQGSSTSVVKQLQAIQIQK